MFFFGYVKTRVFKRQARVQKLPPFLGSREILKNVKKGRRSKVHAVSWTKSEGNERNCVCSCGWNVKDMSPPYLDLLDSRYVKFLPKLVGFWGEFRHNFYTQKEDPVMYRIFKLRLVDLCW